MARVVAAVALGSNLGDRRAHLSFAQEALARILHAPRFSAVVETAPVGIRGAQTPFLNAAAVGEWLLGPHDLLTHLQAIENTRGRTRPHALAPRTLDLDLILFGDRVLSEPGLVIPHPRFRDRLFVLEPLCEVGAELIDPVTGSTVAELLGALRGE